MQQVTPLGRQLIEKTSSLLSSAGCDLLRYDLTPIGNLDADLLGGKVVREMNATVHGSCSLQFTRELDWATVLARPWMALHDPVNPGSFVRWNLGVFALTTPKKTLGYNQVTFDVTGYDRLYLLDRQVGNTYSVKAGVRYLTAVRSAITAAGLTGVLLDSSDATKTLPKSMTWPLVSEYDTDPENGQSDTSDLAGPSTWLNVVNDLLEAIGYSPLWCDENGYFRSEPNLAPAARATDWTFDVPGATNILADDRSITADDWNLPNKWIFVRQGLETQPTTANGGIWIYTDAASVARRGGLVWPKQVQLQAADFASLQRQGRAIIAADQAGTSVEVESSPFPPAGHRDVYRVVDPEMGGDFRVSAYRWELDLLGENMRHAWRRI